MDTPPIGVAIIEARRGVWAAFCAQAREFRLSGQQCWALLALRGSPGATPGELAEELFLDPPSASRLVALLVRRGLVESEPDREDRRKSRLRLTPDGESLGDRLDVAVGRFRSGLEAGLTPEEVAAVRAGLRRILENARSLETGRAPVVVGSADPDAPGEDRGAGRAVPAGMPVRTLTPGPTLTPPPSRRAS